jgi:hypothetical protein
MTQLGTWVLIIAAVGTASLGNAISSIWATGENKVSVWLWLMLLLSPLVFVTFGLVAARTGLSIAAGTVDALLTIVTIVIGLLFFGEWAKISLWQYVGIALSVTGICLMLFFPKPST